jgi:hypothetical protein
MAVAEETKKALLWDQVGERIYETGDRNVALYVYQDTEETFTDKKSTDPSVSDTLTVKTHFYNGVAWNGITAMTESPSGAEPTDLWADDTKYATLRSAEQFGGTIEAYTYPDAWGHCDGTETPIDGVFLGQQKRKQFSLAYITTEGNDVDLNDFGEKIHLVYAATASPSERSYATINDSPEAITFSWEYTTSPVDCKYNGTEYKKLSCITLSERGICYQKNGSSWSKVEAKAKKWEAFKQILFGADPDATAQTEGINPHLPMPSDVVAFFQ